jgi:hypothetical protein
MSVLFGWWAIGFFITFVMTQDVGMAVLIPACFIGSAIVFVGISSIINKGINEELNEK